jgi:hypothetical protein
VPGGAADHAQVALLEAVAVGPGQPDVVVGRKVQRRGRQRRLREQPLEVGADAVGEGHVAPVLHRLRALDARAGLEHEHGVALARELVGDHRADHAGADDDHVGRRVAIWIECCFLHREMFVCCVGR